MNKLRKCLACGGRGMIPVRLRGCRPRAKDCSVCDGKGVVMCLQKAGFSLLRKATLGSVGPAFSSLVGLS